MSICGLILAAGGSSRLGRPKQLVRIREKTLLEQAVTMALNSGLQQLYVVLGACFDEIEPTISHLPVTIIRNEQWQEGMGGSISRGMNAILEAGRHEAVLIMLCDQLHITAEHLQALSEAYEQKKGSIVVTDYGVQKGVPAIFDRSYFPELEKLSGDTGAKKILQQHADRLHSISFEQALIDVDTPEDLHQNGLD